jgi:hypothetical protein
MKHLGQRYVPYINRTYQRSGTLWEGPFRSCRVQERGDLLSCYRHIELNPVRAGMVTHPHSTAGAATGQMERVNSSELKGAGSLLPHKRSIKKA